MRSLPAVLLSLLLLASGCGGGDEPSSQTTAPAEEVTAPATDVADQSSPPAETEAAETEAGEAVLVLEPGALGFTDDSGSTTRLSFDDTDAEQAVQALTTTLGEPTDEEEGLECGPGQLDVVSWDGFSTYYLDGALAGWYLQEPQPDAQDLTTAGGVGLGTKLGDVRENYDEVTVDETTIGYEFAAGELSGILTADSDHDTVVVLWSGANCIAR